MKHAILALILAVPAAAQNRAAEVDFENQLQEMESAQAKAVERAKAIAAIERTLVAMNDGPEAGGRVVAYLDDNGIEVKLGSDVQTDPVSVTVRAGKTTLWLNPALPAYPRVYGPLIAKEVAAKMYADMPACAERAYMVRGTAGRVWLELGGEPAKLPVIEGLKNLAVPAVSEAMGAWATDAAQMALYKIGQAENLAELYEMGESPAHESANKRFVIFLLDERDARNASGLR
ncbi:MAG: hypothetical protein Q8T11_18130 [Elusimicrobiota bacterium]|nr:hypothetical protein [Elusimicrobiota bacterium]